MNLIDFCSSKTSNDVFVSGYQDYFYTDNLQDYYVFILAMKVGDNAYKNTFLSVVNIGQGHRYLLTPWDMDMSLGGYYNGDYYDEISTLDRFNNIAPFNRLIVQDIDGFSFGLFNRWAELSEPLFSIEEISRRLGT